MTMPPTITVAPRAARALPGWAKLLPGFALCVVIGGVALLVGDAVPLVGAPLFAIAIGVLVANTMRDTLRLASLKIGDISKLCLKTGIVILGGSLDLGQIAQTGGSSLGFLAVTVTAGLVTALVLGKWLGLDWRMRCLIGMGTTICGASAIAALAPVIRAKGEEIAYAVTVVFFFNMIAVFLFPTLGHLFGLSDNGFGIWTGTAVNDTSAVVAAGFTPGEADQLRRAMGAWRRPGVIEQFRQKLIDGMRAKGLSDEFAEQVFTQIRGFGEYGFPESHAASFALLVYVSAWLKHYYPAAFAAALLNSQPMGFYAPAQLVRNAREHGVPIRPIDVNHSRWDCTLEDLIPPSPLAGRAIACGTLR